MEGGKWGAIAVRVLVLPSHRDIPSRHQKVPRKGNVAIVYPCRVPRTVHICLVWGVVAWWVEQQTVDPEDQGSNPAAASLKLRQFSSLHSASVSTRQ